MNLEINCNSAQNAIKVHKSTEVLKKILKNISTPEEEAKEIIRIFNKIKCNEWISIEEEIKITNCVSNWKFVLELRNILNNATIDKKREKEFSLENILITVLKYITTSSVIDVLEKRENWDEIDLSEKKYIKIISNWWKSIYLEIIDKKWEFLYCQDIKSNKKKIINSTSNNIVFESRWEFKIKDIQYLDWWIIIENINKSWEDYLIVENYSISFSKQSSIHIWKYDLFIIDPISSKIFKIDLRNHRLNQIDLSQYNIIDVKKWNILLLQPPISYKSWKNEIITDWLLSLYSTDLNDDIIKNIHLKYYKMTKKQFVCLSYDEEIFYKYDFESKKLESFFIETTWLSWDDLWQDLLKKQDFTT